MAFTFTNYPILTPEQQNPFQGALSNALKTYNQGADAAFKVPNLQEALMKAHLANEHATKENKWYEPNIQSEIGLRGAQAGEAGARTGFIGQQSKWYGPDMESQLALREAQKGLYGGQGEKARAEAEKIRYMLQQYDNTGSEGQQMGAPGQQPEVHSAQGAPQMQGSMPPQGANAPYGIPTPQPTRQDLLNKELWGIDSYADRAKQAYEQQNTQQKGYMERSLQTNQATASANNFSQLLDRYNYLMDRSISTGPIGSKNPIPTAETQAIDNVANEMKLKGIERLRSAMGSSRFSNLDMSVAESMKPTRSWTPGAREFYTDFSKASAQRINEEAQFYRVASSPKMGIPHQVADALWTSYQEHHPLVKSEQTKELNKYEPHNWTKYLSPEAIKSITEKGDYDPKNKGLLKEVKLTSAQKKLAENVSLDYLMKAKIMIEAKKRKSK